MMKVYAPFKFDIMDALQHKALHAAQDGTMLAMRDEERAQMVMEVMQRERGASLSAYACGPEKDQYVYLPACTGIATLDIPDKAIEGEAGIIRPKAEWIQDVKIYIMPDVSHGTMQFAQTPGGLEPDYTILYKQLANRFGDLARISARIAREKPENLESVDLNDARARDSLSALYNASGIVHRNVAYTDDLNEEKHALHWGLEYLRPYLKAMDDTMSLDGIIKHVHSLEDEFRSTFPEMQAKAPNFYVAAAMTVSTMMQAHIDMSTSETERTIFQSLKNNADTDVREFETQHLVDDIQEEPQYDEQSLDEPAECL